MNVAVVVAGGLVETLQAAPLLGSLNVGGTRVVLAAPPVARALDGALRGVDEMVFLRALGSHGSVARAAVTLRRRRLDTALVCSSRPRERLLVYAAGCARRAGPGGGPLALLLTERVPDGERSNRSIAWLQMAPAIGATAPAPARLLDPGEVARRRAEALLLGGGFEDGRLLIALVPGSVEGSSPDTLRWDPERWAHLANRVAERHGAGVVLLGGDGDADTVQRVLLDVSAPVLDLGGQLSLLETAAVAERCDLLVAADSPLLHLAAAGGTPTVGLFGPSDGRRRGPWGAEHRVVQAVEGGRGGHMERIRVDDVLAAIESRLA